MIIKSYEIQKNPQAFLKYNLFLLYGENYGLKKDIIDSLKKTLNKENAKLEFQSTYENEIIDGTDNFYNSVYSGSLFGDTKIIIINNGTDKILKQIKDILERYKRIVFRIFFQVSF